MDSLLQQLTDWLKEILISGIMDNLTNTFVSVNREVGEIANTVGQTPSGFLLGVYSLIRNLSENVIMPVAGIILTFIACYELIQLVISHNNLANFETWILGKWVFKTFVAITLITNTCRNEEKLRAAMTDEQKALFEKYTDCIREHQTITECLIFQNSFKLGARMMLGVMEK